jgi:hypothetical protein
LRTLEISQKSVISPADFSMRRIRILRRSVRLPGVPMNLDHKPCGGSFMKSEYPSNPTPSYCQEDPQPHSSRLMDEKMSDDSDAEARIDSALKPAGLKNPFWK